MLPQVFSILSGDTSVAALVGTRIYRHGNAPQGVTAPYITWFVVSGIPENELSDLPRIDRYQVQVDCWSSNTGGGDTQIEALAEAVRDAIEPHAHMVAVVANGIDYETQRLRLGMSFDFWTPRPAQSSGP